MTWKTTTIRQIALIICCLLISGAAIGLVCGFSVFHQSQESRRKGASESGLPAGLYPISGKTGSIGTHGFWLIRTGPPVFVATGATVRGFNLFDLRPDEDVSVLCYRNETPGELSEREWALINNLYTWTDGLEPRQVRCLTTSERPSVFAAFIRRTGYEERAILEAIAPILRATKESARQIEPNDRIKPEMNRTRENQ